MIYDWTVTIGGVDVSALVKAGGTIDYGKATRATSFQAPTAVFEMFTEADYPNYSGTFPTIDLDDPVLIHVTWDGVTQWRRFTGKVQAIDWNTTGMRVTCAGTSVDWDGKTCGDLSEGPPFIEVVDELETTRVEWLAADAGVSLTVEGVPARRVRGIPQYSPGQPLLDALLRIADDCDALLSEDRLGTVRYRTRNFDRPAPYTLPPALVERDSIDMAYERGTLINDVRVYYGEPDPDTGQQAFFPFDDSAGANTIGTIGRRYTDLYTDIEYERGAEGKAKVYLERNRLEWTIPDITLVMSLATGEQADAILDLQENWMVEVTDLPDGCPIASYDGDVLGFTEFMHQSDYRLTLHLGPRIADTGAIPEEPIFAADSMTGGTESTYEDEFGFLWQVHVFDTPGTYTLTCNSPVTGDSLVVAGGGNGTAGNLSNRGGGGGAGAVFSGELSFTPGTIPVEVGAAGVRSVLSEVWVYGGGQGGAPGGGTGGTGGFGGGAGSPYATGGTGTYGSLDAGATTNTSVILGGNGSNSASSSGAGGGASLSSSITGTTVVYAKPGGASFTNVPGVDGDTPGSGGQGGGNLSNPGGAGAPGIVAYRYRIA